jgi:hypothetical protein
MFTPAAPIASAATRLRASAISPEATKGIFRSSAARGSRIIFGISSSPGWPPHSKPSTLTASQLIFSAFGECRTQVHLWIAQRRSRSSIATMLYNAEFRRSL